MKRVRGFGYVPDAVEDGEELEPDEVELELGTGVEHSDPDSLEVRAYSCPRCKRVLFEADVSLHGVIFIRCRKCKRKVAIETTPTMQRIGFINPLRKEKDQNDV